MHIAIVIPTYNEADNINLLTLQIFALNLPNLEIIFVDDNSPDGTGDIIKQLQTKFPIHLIERPTKLGLGSAYIAGFKYALSTPAEYIFEMDADFSHDPADIPRLISACATGADLAIGSRRVPGGKIVGWNCWRHFTSFAATTFSRFILKLTVKDVTAGFRCFKKNVLAKIDLNSIKSDGYAFQEELLYKVHQMGFNIVEVPVVFNDRSRGQSKLSKKDILEFFLIIFKLKI
ncbi:MAG: polyprenol monophosphomannose synthase [bacterium]|nr:polyprenol monophosphomannose synthase [bacterium]